MARAKRANSNNPFMRSFQSPSTAGGSSKMMGQTGSSFGGEQTTKSAFTQLAQTAPYSTPFYLIEDRTNKYKINEKLKRTIANKNEIPFLRTNDDEYIKLVRPRRGNSFSSSFMGSEG